MIKLYHQYFSFLGFNGQIIYWPTVSMCSELWFRGVTLSLIALFWLVQTEMLLSTFKWHGRLLKLLISNKTAALCWWEQLIIKYKMCICKIKQAADSYTDKVIMAQILQPNNAELPWGTNQKLILIIMWILH